MLKLNLTLWLKLNQQKIWKTEPMENLHLNVETSLFLNVKTEPRMKWCGDRETKPMENLHLENGILASAIKKKLKMVAIS